MAIAVPQADRERVQAVARETRGRMRQASRNARRHADELIRQAQERIGRAHALEARWERRQ